MVLGVVFRSWYISKFMYSRIPRGALDHILIANGIKYLDIFVLTLAILQSIENTKFNIFSDFSSDLYFSLVALLLVD